MHTNIMLDGPLKFWRDNLSFEWLCSFATLAQPHQECFARAQLCIVIVFILCLLVALRKS